jgi:hypothetical protein
MKNTKKIDTSNRKSLKKQNKPKPSKRANEKSWIK